MPVHPINLRSPSRLFLHVEWHNRSAINRSKGHKSALKQATDACPSSRILGMTRHYNIVQHAIATQNGRPPPRLVKKIGTLIGGWEGKEIRDTIVFQGLSHLALVLGPRDVNGAQSPTSNVRSGRTIKYNYGPNLVQFWFFLFETRKRRPAH